MAASTDYHGMALLIVGSMIAACTSSARLPEPTGTSLSPTAAPSATPTGTPSSRHRVSRKHRPPTSQRRRPRRWRISAPASC